MISPVKMKKLTAIVLKEYAEDVAKKLLEVGLIDFIDMDDLPVELKNTNEEERVDPRSINELSERVEVFLNMISLTNSLPKELKIADLKEINTEKMGSELDRLSGDLQKIREDQRLIQEKILQQEEIQRQIPSLPHDLNSFHSKGLLNFNKGIIKTIDKDSFIRTMARIPSFYTTFDVEENNSIFVILAMSREKSSIVKKLEQLDYKECQLPTSIECNGESLRNKLETQLSQLRDKQESKNREIKKTLESKSDSLIKMWSDLNANLLFRQIYENFTETSHAAIFSGWVPAKKTTLMEKLLNEASKENCFIKWADSKEVLSEESRTEIPVKLSHRALFKPFQMIVENFAVPSYGTIDPTAFTVLTYLLMFGLMFGDAGHGLVLILVGLGGLISKKVKFEKIFMLMIWCGFSAIVFGILFGSYFGMNWIKPLWFDYHGIIAGEVHSVSLVNTIFDVLAITVYFGIFIIYLGLILNWLNLFILKKWIELFLDKKGLLGGWLYGAGIYSTLYFIRSGYKEMPSFNLLIMILIVPIMMLFFKSPLEHFLNKNENHEPSHSKGLMTEFIMDGLVETLETFTGYLSNTLSFMRIAGLGIAHISLMIAFFQIAELIDNPVFSILILVLGNSLVIALEGLSAGIQSLRLNYYEFYSKYFNGKGREFAPISLKLKTKKESL